MSRDRMELDCSALQALVQGAESVFQKQKDPAPR